MRISCFLNKRATPNGATPRHITALRFKVAPQRCLYPSCSMYIVSLDSRRRQLAQFPPDRRLNLLRTGGSSHTGQAAPPHRNIHNSETNSVFYSQLIVFLIRVSPLRKALISSSVLVVVPNNLMILGLGILSFYSTSFAIFSIYTSNLSCSFFKQI